MQALIFAILAASAPPGGPKAGKPVREPAPALAQCVEGVPEDSASRPAVLRPTQTARCPYGIGGAYERLVEILRVGKGGVDLEYVERLFGLPKLYTAYDDPRMVSYSVHLTGGSEETGWRGLLTFQEGFWPMVDSRPERFRGSKRPVRIRKGESGDVRLSIMLFPPVPGRPWPACVTVSDYVGRASKAGWKYSDSPVTFSHGGGSVPTLERPGVRLTPEIGIAGDCLADVTVDQSADPPIPPITREEQEASRRKSAMDFAGATEERWLALPASDEDDRQARNAQAKFIRDRMIKLRDDPGSGPSDSTINSMTIEQLRNFARRAVSGFDWLAQRELCERAVMEADPPAALARFATERKLDPATAQLLYARCAIYVEGRRFRHLALPPP